MSAVIDGLLSERESLAGTDETVQKAVETAATNAIELDASAVTIPALRASAIDEEVASEFARVGSSRRAVTRGPQGASTKRGRR